MIKKKSIFLAILLVQVNFAQFSLLNGLTAVPDQIGLANDLALRAIQRIQQSVGRNDDVTNSILSSFIITLNEGLSMLASENQVDGQVLSSVVQNLGNISVSIVAGLGQNETQSRIQEATDNAIQQLTEQENIRSVLSDFGDFIGQSITAASEMLGTAFNSTEFETVFEIGQKIVDIVAVTKTRYFLYTS